MVGTTSDYVRKAALFLAKWREVEARCVTRSGDGNRYTDEGKQELIDFNSSLDFFRLKESEEVGMSTKVKIVDRIEAAASTAMPLPKARPTGTGTGGPAAAAVASCPGRPKAHARAPR